MMCPLVVFVCMSLADVEYTLLSYATFAALLAGLFFMAVVYLRNFEMSRYGIMSFITMMFLIVTSFINIDDSDIKSAIYMAFEIWMFQILFFYYRNRIHVVVMAATVFLSLCVYANFVHMMLHPNLWIMDNDKSVLGYLLGYNYNGMGFRFIPAITFSFLCLRYSWKWIFNAIGVTIFSIIPLILTGSKTSLIGILIFIFICCIPYAKVQKHITNGLLVFVLLFQIFVVFSGKGLENNELAVYIIEDLLEKDITFTYRTYLWDMSINKIMESPLYGFGNLDYIWYASHIHTVVGTGPCNLVLSLLLNGGIMLLGFFGTVFFMSIRQVMRCSERSANIIQLGLTVIMLMHLMEALTYAFCFFLMTLAYYYPYIKKEFPATKNLL